MSTVRIAVEGCGHGTLHAIYNSVKQTCEIKGWSGVDLVIICGDFQAVRNAYDLNCVAMPVKYREMCDFHEYYSGKRRAPYLTIFVGGNHEASNYMYELYYGGWVAENIYYMGAASVVNLGPLKIAGMSGIWKGYNYNKLHYERLPYNEDDIKSIYHVRELDTRKLLQYKGSVDIGISHDWPRGVEWKGDWQQLFRFKAHLESDARSGQLGSTAAKLVLDHLQPQWWFSGHLHCKYAAIVDHNTGQDTAEVSETEIKIKDFKPPQEVRAVAGVQLIENPDEIELDIDDSDEPTLGGGKTDPNEIDLDVDDDHSKDVVVMESASTSVMPTNKTTGHNKDITTNGKDQKLTHFLALDKCMPRRHFLQLMEVPVISDDELQRPLSLSYDREWLAIIRAFALAEQPVLGDHSFNPPKIKSKDEYNSLIQAESSFVDSIPNLSIPLNFTITAPVYDGGDIRDPRYTQQAGGLKEYSNPQTSAFCAMLQIPNPFDISEERRMERMAKGARPASDRSEWVNGSMHRRGGHSSVSRAGRGYHRGRGNRGGGHRGRGRGG